MKTPKDLSREDLEHIVEQVQRLLWYDDRTGEFVYAKPWPPYRDLDLFAEMVEGYGLAPPDEEDDVTVA